MPYNDYDAMVGTYVERNENNVFNAHYERPAMLSTLGAVEGLRMLDAGCGSGTLAGELARRGARVTGIDSSRGMLKVARRNLLDTVDLQRVDLERPLPFADRSFDVVCASLVMHYLADWEPTLREFARVLVPGGRFVMSTHHPFADHNIAGSDNYFARYTFTEDWPGDGRRVRMRFWHRPLTAMSTALLDSNFALESVFEPRPHESAKEVNSAQYERLRTKPAFLFLTARAVELAGQVQ